MNSLTLAFCIVLYWFIAIWRVYRPQTDKIEKVAWLISSLIILAYLFTL